MHNQKKLLIWDPQSPLFKDKLIRSHQNIYLAILSIILGVAIAFLANNSVSLLFLKKNGLIESLINHDLSYFVKSIFSIATTGIVIFYTFYEYMWDTMLYERIVRLRDIIAIYLLGFLEILLTFFMENLFIWSLIASFSAIIGVFAYRNTITSLQSTYTDKKGQNNKLRIEISISHAKTSCKRCFFLSIFLFVGSFWMYKYCPPIFCQALYLLFIIFVFIYAIFKSRNYTNLIYSKLYRDDHHRINKRIPLLFHYRIHSRLSQKQSE